MKPASLKIGPVFMAAGVLGLVYLLQAAPLLFPKLDFFERLEWMSYDWRQRLASERQPPVAPNLAAVFIGDKDLAAINQYYQYTFPWPRYLYGWLVQELSDQQASAVAFDIFFADALQEDAKTEQRLVADGIRIGSDDYFARQLRAAGDVVLPVWGSLDTNRQWHASLPLDLFQTNALALCHIWSQPDSDGILRRVPAFEEDPRHPEAGRVWQMGIVLAARALQLDLKHPILRPGRIILRDAQGAEHVLPIDREGCLYIDWSLKWDDERIHHEPVLSLLLDHEARRVGRTQSAARWRGQIVVVGSTGAGNNISATGATPVDKSTFLVSEHLNIANSILTGRLIRKSSYLTEMLAILLMSGVTAGLWWGLRPPWAMTGIAGVIGLYVGSGIWLYVRHRYALAFVLPLACSVPPFCIVAYQTVVGAFVNAPLAEMFFPGARPSLRPRTGSQPLAPPGPLPSGEPDASRRMPAPVWDGLLGHPQGQVEAYRQKHRTGLLTCLFTDVVGSAALKEALGDRQAATLIQEHRGIVRDLLRSFPEAEEIETAGDLFLLVFTRPSDGVLYALTLQRRLLRWRQETGSPLQLRVGIHLGEVIIEEHTEAGKRKDLYGSQLDLCARVLSLGQGNQVLMTRGVFDNARRILKGQDLEGAEAVAWLNHGLYLLKGSDEPVEICEVRAGGVELGAPLASTEKARRYTLPGEETVLGWRPAAGQAVARTQWVLESKLGEGGFGEVWLARHARLKEQRVFKFCFRADRVRMLKREMTLFRLLRERVGEHPQIVRLLEVNLEQPPAYLEQEYVSGRDLRTWCQAQGGIDKVPLDRRLEIVAQAADGLAAAHTAGIIHRDIKPGNILISPPSTFHPEPSAKLNDFGIGQVVSAECLAGVTSTGFTGSGAPGTASAPSGTHLYMAPEVLAGSAPSVQSDLYSLGVVLYQLWVGDFRRPVTTDWGRDVNDALLREDLQRCFAGNPAERFGSAGELARNLRRLSERRQRREVAARQTFEVGATKVASLAVLPFVNLGPEAANESLSDGITEDLITALSRVPGLQVPGRTSCFACKGKAGDLRQIGQTLNVETVLEGSVRQAGSRLRITAQLIDVLNGFHLWSERYDRETADVFAVQDEIVKSILEALGPKLGIGQGSRQSPSSPDR